MSPENRHLGRLDDRLVAVFPLRIAVDALLGIRQDPSEKYDSIG